MLPERFPEYAIMHNTLLREIKRLGKTRDFTPEKLSEIQTKIQKYQVELERIEKMFPENFFGNKEKSV